MLNILLPYLYVFSLQIYPLLSSDGPSQINFVTIGKEAYLLEVPESLRGNIPRDYELRSSKKVNNKKGINYDCKELPAV